MKSLLTLAILSLLFSCAGPTNPFGGDILISDTFTISESLENHDVHIEMTPDRQYYNSPYDLSIRINDPNFNIKNFKYEIVYNNKKLNRWLKSEEIIIPKKPGEPVEIHFKNLSLLPGNINKIAFLYYPAGQSSPLIHKLEVPECLKSMAQEKINISPFKISSSIKNNIVNIAHKYEYNPSLIAGLIAQESSFNTHAISAAKALGLTQVTPIAHREIAKVKEDWEIHPTFDRYSYLRLKYLLRAKTITPKNDWRLDPKKSIEGGIIYLNYLGNYWSTPEKTILLHEVFEHDIPMTDILLASYNSGAFRVKKAIKNHQRNWLFDPSLNEARKYVMNIKSYCYAFNKGSSL